MGDADMIDVNFTDRDLDAMGVGSFSNESAAARGNIEERIRHLDGVAARQRRSSRDRRNPTEINHYFSGHYMGIIAEEISEKEKNFFNKGDSSYLVAEALGLDSLPQKDENLNNCNNGSYYDCNICFSIAKEPVLICCGHLFCWACFYEVEEIYSNSNSKQKQCPVCKGDASLNTTVIYCNGGGGGSNFVSMAKLGLIKPSRVKAMGTKSPTKERDDVKENDVSVSSDFSFEEWLVEELQSSISDGFSVNDANGFSFSFNNRGVDDANSEMLFGDGDGSDVKMNSCLVRKESTISTQDERETRRRRLN